MIMHKPDCYGKGQCDCEPQSEAWAIVDLAVPTCSRWFTGYGGTPRRAQWGTDALRYQDQRDAANTLLSLGGPTLRIVPVAPREMTDAECVAWLEHVTATDSNGVNGIRYIPGHRADGAWVNGFWHVKNQDGSSAGQSPRFFDAIRAARRALEAKR